MTLKAGSNLNRIESTIHSDQPGDLTIGIGLAVRDGEGKLVEDKDHGVISYWQPSEKDRHDRCWRSGRSNSSSWFR